MNINNLNLKFKHRFSKETSHDGEFLKLSTRDNIVAWFAGTAIDDVEQFDRFISEGIWEHGFKTKLHNEVNSINVGDLIAAKSSYTKKNNLPFNNNNKFVSVMGIKAIGIVTENLNNGRRIKVQWKQLDEVKEWYFFTYRNTLRKVMYNTNWKTKALIDFAFFDEKQDYSRFLND